MTTSQLIQILSQFPPDTLVTLWHDGERVGACDIDDSFVMDHGFVEINSEQHKE